jgi:hypothetical protein
MRRPAGAEAQRRMPAGAGFNEARRPTTAKADRGGKGARPAAGALRGAVTVVKLSLGYAVLRTAALGAI